MPICLEPNELFDVVLDSDKNKPVETRPVFKVKALSIRKQRLLSQFMQSRINQNLSDEQFFDQTLDKLSELIVDWVNIPTPFSREAMEDLLISKEASQLLRKIYTNDHLDSDEKKSSELQPT